MAYVDTDSKPGWQPGEPMMLMQCGPIAIVTSERPQVQPNKTWFDQDRKFDQRVLRRLYNYKRCRALNFVCKCCGVTETPETRRGPHGKNTLCNACGLRWKKNPSMDFFNEMKIQHMKSRMAISFLLNHED